MCWCWPQLSFFTALSFWSAYSKINYSAAQYWLQTVKHFGKLIIKLNFIRDLKIYLMLICVLYRKLVLFFARSRVKCYRISSQQHCYIPYRYNDGGTRAIIDGIEQESITKHCQGLKLVGNQYCIVSFSLILKLGFKVLHYFMADIAQIRQLVITHDWNRIPRLKPNSLALRTPGFARFALCENNNFIHLSIMNSPNGRGMHYHP